MTLSGYRIVWTFVLFDLPVVDPDDRRQYMRFRKLLLEEGFDMMQFSVYARCSPSEDRARIIEARIVAALPPDGCVRIFQMTDRQFGMMRCYHGKLPEVPEPAAEQLQFL